jgi:hypothetical protein
MAESNSEETVRRILVLGSAQHTHLVTAYTWDNLPEALDVADYEVVILNFVPLELDNVEFASSIKTQTLPSWHKFARLLFSEGSEVVAIGMLRDRAIGTQYPLPYNWWLPTMPDVEFSPGDEIQRISPEFEFYFKYVKRWSFYATPTFRELSPTLAGYIQVVYPQASDFRHLITPIAETRFHHPVAFELRYQAQARKKPGGATGTVESGKVIWLPQTTELTHVEAVDLILRERYRLGFEQMPPSWVDNYKLPRQVSIEDDIQKHERRIQDLAEILAATKKSLQEETRFRKLLYGKGEDVLEPVVRDALRQLGAHVDDPKQRGREDGRLVDPQGRNGMLEVKGRSGTLRLSDVRELDQWVRDAMANEELNSKGILVANMLSDDPPGQRINPFPDNCTRAAKQFGICLMTGTQLFRAFCSHQKNELDIENFWNTIFDTDGVCALPELEN